MSQITRWGIEPWMNEGNQPIGEIQCKLTIHFWAFDL